MKKTFWIMMMVTVLLLCGCQSKPDPEAVDFSTAPTFAMEEITDYPTFTPLDDGARPTGYSELNTDIGRFYYDRVPDPEGGENAILMFDDASSGESYPLCAKVNCAHTMDSDGCGAFFEIEPIQMYFDGTWLYLVNYEHWGEGAAHIGLIRRKPDGSDREVLIAPRGKENETCTIEKCIFQGNTVYFEMNVMRPGATLGEGAQHITRFCVGDLTTGEYEVLPGRFDDCTILGVSGSELIVHRVTGNGGWEPLENFTDLFFLVDIHTGEINVILELKGGDRVYATDPEAGWMYFKKDDGYDYWVVYEDIPVTNDPEEEMFSTNTGDLYFADIPNRKIYKWSDVDIFSGDGMRNGYWVYMEWNEDHTAAIKYARSIETGETYLYNEIFH